MPIGRMQLCTRAEDHTGPCNGWPAATCPAMKTWESFRDMFHITANAGAAAQQERDEWKAKAEREAEAATQWHRQFVDLDAEHRRLQAQHANQRDTIIAHQKTEDELRTTVRKLREQPTYIVNQVPDTGAFTDVLKDLLRQWRGRAESEAMRAANLRVKLDDVERINRRQSDVIAQQEEQRQKNIRDLAKLTVAHTTLQQQVAGLAQENTRLKTEAAQTRRIRSTLEALRDAIRPGSPLGLRTTEHVVHAGFNLAALPQEESVIRRFWRVSIGSYNATECNTHAEAQKVHSTVFFFIKRLLRESGLGD